jgi:hypothetical protein
MSKYKSDLMKHKSERSGVINIICKHTPLKSKLKSGINLITVLSK